MADFVTHDGREITFDLWLVTRGEFKALFDPKTPIEKDDAVIARASGLTLEQLNALAQPDYNGLTKALVARLHNSQPEEPTLDRPN